MSNTDLHVDKGGTIAKPKTQSPRTIHAWGQAREGFARIIAGALILGLLTVAYILALFMKVEGAQNILLVVGSGMGFLLGRGGRVSHGDQ